MKTPNLLLAAAGLVYAITAAAQLPRIVVDGQGTPMVFTDLGAAMLAAPANSNLYLSGGSFLVPGGFALSKPLHFIGAGMHPDSTNATGATIICTTGSGTFALISGASGTSFTGITFITGASPTITLGTSSGNQFVTDVDFLRCMFNNGVNLGVEEPSGTTSSFTECIFHGPFAGYGGTSVVNRCIFDYTPGTGGMISIFRPTGLYMLNSVVLGGKLDYCPNASIANCVFTYMGGAIWQSQDAQVSNCLFSDTLVFSNCTGLEENNLFGIPADAIFVNELDGQYQFTDDLHLAGSSPGAGAGNDGTDIGIYGTDSPFKPGGVPHTPHYRRIEVAEGTDASGNLPVNVRVVAEPN